MRQICVPSLSHWYVDSFLYSCIVTQILTGIGDHSSRSVVGAMDHVSKLREELLGSLKRMEDATLGMLRFVLLLSRARRLYLASPIFDCYFGELLFHSLIRIRMPSAHIRSRKEYRSSKVLR